MTEPKHTIGESIDTEGFNLAVIRDIYTSKDSECHVYEISPLDNLEQHFLIFSEDVL